MRREGFELSISRPRVCSRRRMASAGADRRSTIDVTRNIRVVIEKLTVTAKGDMAEMKSAGVGKPLSRMSSRGLIGYQASL